MVVKQKAVREEMNESLIQNIGNEILKFQDNLTLEKKVREETHATILKMLKDIDTKLKEQLEVTHPKVIFRKNKRTGPKRNKLY